jgi:hypothetical protein
MTDLEQLTGRRNEILDEMNGIEIMRKGVLNAQYQKVAHKNGEIVVNGPYYVLTKKSLGGKTVSQSIPAKDAPRFQMEVDNYKRFRQLSDEYVDICEKTALLTDGDDDVKKNETSSGSMS